MSQNTLFICYRVKIDNDNLKKSFRSVFIEGPTAEAEMG